MSYIGLLDCNNFFVSCERLFRPDLQTRPTVVLSGNDGCVVARSKEVKEMGIPMGVPYFQVKKELSAVNAAIFSSNFPLYRDISARVMAVLREEMAVVEQYSVDEAFFGLEIDEDRVLEVLIHLRHTVQSKVGIPVSIGAAKTKTIAKYASEVGKKDSGIAFVHSLSWQQAAKTLDISSIWGIGRKTSEKLRSHGVVTVADFLQQDQARIDKLFGIGGLRLFSELSEVVAHRLGSRSGEQKSIMSTRSFKKETTELGVVEDSLAYHIAHAAEELRSLGLKAQYISVMARTSRHGDWFMRGGSNEALLPTPTADTRVLLKEGLRLLRDLYETDVPYKKAGVVLGMFSGAAVEQLDLFGSAEAQRDSTMMSTIDTLNRRFGKETITIGRNIYDTAWKASRDYVSPSYTTKWSDIAEIKT